MHSPIRVRCDCCDARIKAPPQLHGQTRPCPRCGKRLLIATKPPEDSDSVLVPEDAPAPAGRRWAGRF
jgi:uncharacterized paraquat-inducible protein A